MTITVIGETAIQGFSKAKMFILFKNHRNFKYVKNTKERITEIIFASLIANYLAHAALSTLFTCIAIEYLKMSIFYSGIILAVFISIIEISTKKIAISYPERSLLEIGYLYMLIYKCCGKIAMALNYIISYIMIKIFRVKEAQDSGDTDLLSIVELKMEEDQVTGKMIKNILQIKSIYVEDVMTPRNDIISINFNKKTQVMVDQICSLEEDQMKEHLPIWNEAKNIFMGVINTTKFLISLKKKNLSFHSVMEEMFFVPSGTNVYKMLQMFQKRLTKFAFVVNEYGDTVGVITVQDILEEIVGSDIFEDKKAHTEANQILVLDGDMSVKELHKYFSHDFFSDETYSINDLIINNNMYIPEEGEEFTYQNISFIILDRHDHKIEKVLVSAKFPDKV
jgi:Mg2+/Co2+ transporter CorB